MNRYILSFFTVYFIYCPPSAGRDNLYKYIQDESFSTSPMNVNYSALEKLNYKKLSDLSRRTQRSPLYVTGFDEQIDENTYILGTGDGLTVYIWGTINDEIVSIIDHEGNFLIPSIGTVNVRNLTLREGKEKIKEKILSSYKKVKISIVLSIIRRFKVYILGEVVNPGPYIVNGAARVSDLICLTGGLKARGLKDGALKDGALKDKALKNKALKDGVLKDKSLKVDSTFRLRGIEIENEYHSKRYADLALFYHSNIIDKNPYLLEGDRVFVHKKKEFISIHGAVNYPGEYDYMPEDSLITIIIAAGGLGRDADSSRIILKRFANDKDSIITFEFSYDDSSVFTFPIQKDDRILVCSISDYRIHRQVVINGEVRFPGIYPIRKDKTRLMKVIEMAGGLTEDAFLRGSRIVRKVYTRRSDRKFNWLKSMPAGNINALERGYLKTKQTEEEGIVSLDFEELMNKGGNLYNIILRNEDEITIARKDLSIKVTGAVVLPGLVGLKEGAGYDYYINQAGGFNAKARKNQTMIIKGGKQIWLKPKNVERLEAGDAIWIPEKVYRDGLQVTKDILVIVGSLATTIISIFTIRKLLED